MKAELNKHRVKNAIILAAGFGSRCVPLTYETPKGLLEVYGQPMIERQIEQLTEKGITDIIIVVGYKKEAFDYLIDKYNVKLIYNPKYMTKNNLASLYYAAEYLNSSYILPSDIWIENNIFNTFEVQSWYSSIYIDGATNEWCVTTSASDKIKAISIGGKDAWVLMGPAYFSPSFSTGFKQYLTEYYNRPGTDDYYWEHILKEQTQTLPMHINHQSGNVHEFESLEELRVFDPSYNNASNNKIMQSIAKVYNIPEEKIRNIYPIKKGMTNDSFHFAVDNESYVCRIPGAGTDLLINRRNEYNVYQAIAPLNICDDVVYLNPENGYKITMFYKDARVCDPTNANDVKRCMEKLREFHGSGIKTAHTFDPFERILFYESLWSSPSCYKDYDSTKENVMRLKEYIDSIPKEYTLAHIDSVPDNFLFINKDGKEEIRLIDWEYSGMHDPHIDIAMFAVYAMYDEKNVNFLIDSYFVEGCPNDVRLKIYAYVAICGLLWSNWCEYKRQMGIEYGEYAMKQYRYAKDYYQIFNNKG